MNETNLSQDCREEKQASLSWPHLASLNKSPNYFSFLMRREKKREIKREIEREGEWEGEGWEKCIQQLETLFGETQEGTKKRDRVLDSISFRGDLFLSLSFSTLSPSFFFPYLLPMRCYYFTLKYLKGKKFYVFFN